MYRFTKYVLITVVSIVTFGTCYADSTFRNPLEISYKFNLGKIWVHTPKLNAIPITPLHVHSLMLLQKVSGSSEWHWAYNYPLYGLEINIVDFGNSNVLGRSYGLAPHIIFPIIERRMYSGSIAVSPGINYFDKVYNASSNPTNFAISSRFNAFIQVGLLSEFNLSPKFKLGVGMNFIHTSNATLKKPNSGLNMVSGFTQIRFALNDNRSKNKAVLNHSPNFPKHRFKLLTAGAIKEIKEPGGNKYWVAITSFEYQRALSPFSAVGITTDLFYDSSSEVDAIDQNIEYSNPLVLSKLGISAVSEFRLDRLSLALHIGTYAYNLTKDGKNIYQRIGLRYRILNQNSLVLGLKGHMFTGGYLAIADHIELGFVFSFQ